MTATEAWRRVGGAAALAGGVMWTAKSLSILVTGHQPPLLLEGGMPLFGLALVGLVADGPGSATRRVAGGLGVLAAVTGSLALGADLAGEVWHVAIAAATIAVIGGLVVVGATDRRAPGSRGVRGRVALALGAGTIPAVLVGGGLALLHERLLEVPLVMLGVTWTWLGVLMLRVRTPARRTGP